MGAKGFLLSALALSTMSATARGGVIVVDAGGGGQFTQIQAAVDAAADGDTLLVKAGNYDGFRIMAKSLTVAGEANATVRVNYRVEVDSLDAAGRVVLSRLVIHNSFPPFDPGVPEEVYTGLYLHDNSGALRIEDCTISGSYGFNDAYCSCFPGRPCSGGIGALVESNPNGVAFVRSTISGGGSAGIYMCYCTPPTSFDGNTGLHLSGGLVALYDCTVAGGDGGASCDTSGTGGEGVHIASSGTLTGLILSGSQIRGGNGGFPVDSGKLALHGGDGGDGLVVGDKTAVWQLETTVTGGSGTPGVQSNGEDGLAIVSFGKIFPFTVPRLRLETPSIAREQQVVPLTVRGRPGDEIYLYMGANTPFQARASWHGVRLAQNPHPEFVAIVGTIPASGVLDSAIMFPELDPSVEARNWYLQAWRNSPIDGRTLGSFRVVTVLDSSF